MDTLAQYAHATNRFFDHLVKTSAPGNAAGQGGDLAAGEGLATQKFDETYRKGYVAHAPMETHTAVAAVENGKVTVWAGTQSPFGLKGQIVSALALPAEQGPRDHAVRRRRVRRQEQRASRAWRRRGWRWPPACRCA